MIHSLQLSFPIQTFSFKDFDDHIKPCGRTITRLFLSNFKTTNSDGILTEDWLTFNSTDHNKQIYLDELIIRDSDIKKINPNSFAGKLFTKLVYIYFNALSETIHFQQGILNGLNHLTRLELRDIGMSMFDESFLEPVKKSLQKIEIHEANRVNPQSIKNLFSVGLLIETPEIVLDGKFINSLIIDTFLYQKKIYFLRFRGVKSILSMEKKLLNPLTSVRWWDVRGALINSLPVGCLDKQLHKKEFTIEIDGNNWICDCRAQYVVDANKIANLSGNNRLFDRDLICGYPQRHKGKKLLTDELDLCSNTDMMCPSLKKKLPLSMKKIEFNIRMLSNSSVSIDIHSHMENQNDWSIVWFMGNTLSSFDDTFSCLPITNSTVLIQHLENNISYTFCIVSTEYDTHLFLPFNCLTLPFNEKGDIIWNIILIVILALIGIGCGISFLYYYKLSITNNSQIVKLEHQIAIIKKRYVCNLILRRCALILYWLINNYRYMPLPDPPQNNTDYEYTQIVENSNTYEDVDYNAGTKKLERHPRRSNSKFSYFNENSLYL